MMSSLVIVIKRHKKLFVKKFARKESDEAQSDIQFDLKIQSEREENVFDRFDQRRFDGHSIFFTKKNKQCSSMQ